ncbi:nicotinate phosphoribosyltransferase [Helicobacter cholecystus]|uniref:Nicotinate phosphoribosyltransferase n=1 Tax=Helicobacter cholecystus TaxID=45498 RepID=A0A3D8IYM4_9HELI|nr:phosphoribosyltransferase family protein [Helicobacter cholecystus]RDU70005.1 nicotinate phosphoribosyltransferase [Helicobacter cholecystus]VEJ24825.1 nucleotide phosphoribosyltransferase [Helicobacter cholecystus]
MKYYSYEEFLQDLKDLYNKIDNEIGKPDAIIAISRGGLTMAHLLSLRWDLREVYTLNAISYQGDKQGDLIIKNIPSIPEEFDKVLIVDEIVDSGKSLIKIVDMLKSLNPCINFYTSAIFQKSTAIFQADFFLKEPMDWIDFFWEKDMFE